MTITCCHVTNLLPAPGGQRGEPVPDTTLSAPGGRTSAGVASHMSSTGSALGQVPEEEPEKLTGNSSESSLILY